MTEHGLVSEEAGCFVAWGPERQLERVADVLNAAGMANGRSYWDGPHFWVRAADGLPDDPDEAGPLLVRAGHPEAGRVRAALSLLELVPYWDGVFDYVTGGGV